MTRYYLETWASAAAPVLVERDVLTGEGLDWTSLDVRRAPAEPDGRELRQRLALKRFASRESQTNEEERT